MSLWLLAKFLATFLEKGQQHSLSPYILNKLPAVSRLCITDVQSSGPQLYQLFLLIAVALEAVNKNKKPDRTNCVHSHLPAIVILCVNGVNSQLGGLPLIQTSL